MAEAPAPGLVDAFVRGTREDPILAARPMNVAAIRVANRQEAALNLGKIYQLLRDEDRRLGNWALPTHRSVTDERVLAYQLDAPTAVVMGAQLDLETRIRKYDGYFNAVMPDVLKQAQAWGQKTLREQSENLLALWLEISDENFAAWMSQSATEITRRASDCFEQARVNAAQSGAWAIDPRLANRALARKRAREIIDTYKSCHVKATKSFVSSPPTDHSIASYLKPQRPPAVEARYWQLLQILLAHPKINEILERYSNSAAEGTTAAKALIRESYDAIQDFSASLTGSPLTVWRYPILIVGGVQDLGFSDFSGFQDFAIAVGAVEASKSPEALLNYVGIGLMAVAILGTGGIGLAALELAVAGGTTLFTALRERQQEKAVKASLFLPESRKFAAEYGYGETGLALAFTLISAIGVFKVFKAARAAKAAEAAKAQDVANALKHEAKPNVLNDAARGKENAAPVRPASGKPAQSSAATETPGSGKPQESAQAATQEPPPAGPAKPKVIDEFPELKLAENEAPAIANPTPDQVNDAIKAFKKQLKRFVAVNEEFKAIPFKDFYLTPRQSQTFARLTDAVLGSQSRAIPSAIVGERAVLLSESELVAERLRARLQAHWDAALPRRGKQTAEQAAFDLLTELLNSPPEKGTINSEIRERFFNAWRKRFLTRVAKDKQLLLDLEVQAGVVFKGEGAPSAFTVLVRDEARRLSFVSLDLDHAIIRHEDAVLRAIRANDATLLKSTVNSSNLQLMTARENRYVIERLRELDALYWSAGSGPTPRAIQPFR